MKECIRCKERGRGASGSASPELIIPVTVLDRTVYAIGVVFECEASVSSRSDQPSRFTACRETETESQISADSFHHLQLQPFD